MNLQKDLLLEQLKKEIKDKDFALDRLRGGISENNNIEKVKNDKLSFKEFEGKIGNDDLVRLRSLGGDRKKDSNFVLKCLEALYKENLSVLCERSAEKSSVTKRQLTPEKKEIIERLFSARLNSLNLKYGDEAERKSKLRSLLSNSIRTIRKRQSISSKQATSNTVENREISQCTSSGSSGQ